MESCLRQAARGLPQIQQRNEVLGTARLHESASCVILVAGVEVGAVHSKRIGAGAIGGVVGIVEVGIVGEQAGGFEIVDARRVIFRGVKISGPVGVGLGVGKWQSNDRRKRCPGRLRRRA